MTDEGIRGFLSAPTTQLRKSRRSCVSIRVCSPA
jgi:hypothetical protein